MSKEEEKEIIRKHFSKLGSAKGDCKKRNKDDPDYYVIINNSQYLLAWC